MESTVVIEILDRRGRLKERQRVERLPAVIGRGYGCDVIVDDPFVSPQHLRVERDEGGQIVAIDLQSTNGTRLEGGGAVERVVVNKETVVTIGDTSLRFRVADHPIPPALKLVRRRGITSQATVVAATFLLWLGLMLVAVGSDYLKTYDELRADLLVSRFTGDTLGILLWAGLWAVSNRIVTHRFQFLEHVLNTVFWCLFFVLWDQLNGYVAFALGSDKGINVAVWVVNGILLTGLLYGHLRLCSSLTPRELGYTAGAVAGTITVLSALATVVSYVQGPRWDFALRFRPELKPPMFRVVGSDSVEAFFAKSRELKNKVDDQAVEKK